MARCRGSAAKSDFGETGVAPFSIELDTAHPYRAALRLIRDRVSRRLDGRRIGCGRPPYRPRRQQILHARAPGRECPGRPQGYIPLAPLHQPFALEAVEILLREQPDLHRWLASTRPSTTLCPRSKILPLPYAAWERGLRRYGFHGLSYEYMAVALPERHGDAACGRTVVARLGSGASLCAMQGLKSGPPPWASPRLTA